MPTRLKEILFISVILLGLLAVAFYDIVFLHKTFKITTANPQALITGPYGQQHNKPAFFPVQSTDSSQMEEPLYEFVRKSLHQGYWPLWNPHQACGFPIIAMIEMGMFFPLNFLLYFFPQPYAWDAMIFARFFFAGLFTFWLMRTLRFTRFPSLVAAVIFMLTGPMVLLQYWFTSVEIIAPLLLLTLERLARNPSWRNSGFVALAVGLTFLGGHPEHILFVNSFGFLFFCFRIFSLKSFKKEIILRLTTAYLLGIGLSALTLFPFLYNVKKELWHSHSTNVAITETTNNKLELFSVVTPSFLQKEPVKKNFDREGWWGGYIGVVPFLLALMGLFGKQKKGLNYFLAVLAFLNMTKTYFDFPFFQAIEVLPLFRNCRFYPHTVHLFTLNIAMLAAMGTRVIFAKKDNLKKAIYLAVPLILIWGKALYDLQKTYYFPHSVQASKTGFILLIVFLLILWLKDHASAPKKIMAGVLLGLMIFELFIYIPRERSVRFDSFPQTPYIQFIKNIPERVRVYGMYWSLSPNSASGYQIDDMGIFISLLPKRFVNFVNNLLYPHYFKKDLQTCSFQVYPVTLPSERTPFFDMLNLAFTVGTKDIDPSLRYTKNQTLPTPIYNKEVLLYPSFSVQARSFIVHRAFFEPDEKKMFDRIIQIHKNFRTMIVVQHEIMPDIVNQLAVTPIMDFSQAIITKYTPNEVVINANMDHPGFVVLSDTYHPDWKAFIDGHKTKIYFTNGLVRSVFVEKGEHTIRFIYQPLSFYAGILISLLSFFVMAILLIRKSTAK